MSEDLKNIIWPGWETVNLIGRGSFGAVYEIQRDVFGDVEKAALKVISIPQNDSDIDEMYSDGYDEESITSTFQNHLKSIVTEYSLMRKMNGSANIVNCDDIRYVQHDNGIGWDIFIKMELLTPLAKSLPTDAPEEAVIRVAKDMCAALELCKKHNIVHRDIKPQNIFVSPNGDYKLGDFGIAKTVEKTMGGTKIGTYKYMAPEVYNNQPYGVAADIYSLGLVLYWLLNERRMPFLPLPPAKLTAGEEEQSRNRRLSGEPLPPPAHGSDKLKRIVLKACAPNPKDRYSSAAAMLEDLNGSREDAIATGSETTAPILTDTAKEKTDVSVPEDFEAETAPVYISQIIPNEPAAKPDETANASPWSITEDGAADAYASNDAKTPTDVPLSKPSSKKTRKNANAVRYSLIALAIIAAALIFLLLRTCEDDKKDDYQATSTDGYQADWTEWSEDLPRNISSEEYDIEENTLYSFRTLETTSSTEEKMDGWELYDTIDATGEFGHWSDWTEMKPEEATDREIESQTRYRYRDQETTTGNSSEISSWTLYDTTYTTGNYGSWSSWSTTPVSGSDSREVETKTQYRYRDCNYTTTNNYIPNDWTCYNTNQVYGNWSSWTTTPITETSTLEVQTSNEYQYTRYYLAHYCTGNIPGAQWCTYPNKSSANSVFNANCMYHALGWFDSLSSFSQGNGGYTGSWCSNSCWTWYIMDTEDVYTTYYRSRSITTVYDCYQWGSWSDYSDTYMESSGDREVSTRTLYRYRDCTQIPTYHFSRWGEWSAWAEAEITATDARQVETTQYYRYRDKITVTTYYFKRWTDWSEYTDEPVTPSETVEVQTVTVYRYKSKEQ